MKPTLRTIANELQISPSLVSQVLNGKAGLWASEQTRQRIFDTARELNYRPSASARALVTGRTMQIAIALEIHPDTGNTMSQYVSGIIEAVGERGYRVVMVPLRDQESGARQIEEVALERVCDGVCLFSVMSDASYLRPLEALKMPTVVIGDLPYKLEGQARFVLCVDHDNYLVGRNATAWLMQQGHRRVAWVYAPGEGEQPHTRELRRGYCEAVGDGGTPILLSHDENVESTIDAALSQGVTAVIVRWWQNAMLWTRALRARRLSPDDLALMVLIDEDNVALLYQAGLADGVACLTWSDHRVGQRAAVALLDWVEAGEQAAHSILVAPNAPRRL